MFAVLVLLVIISVLAHDSGILKISDLGTVSIFVVSIIPSALAWTFAMKFSDKVKTLVPTAQGPASKDKKKTVV